MLVSKRSQFLVSDSELFRLFRANSNTINILGLHNAAGTPPLVTSPSRDRSLPVFDK